jgi:hypothetical protein
MLATSAEFGRLKYSYSAFHDEFVIDQLFFIASSVLGRPSYMSTLRFSRLDLPILGKGGSFARRLKNPPAEYLEILFRRTG